MTHVLLFVAVAIWGATFVATKMCLEQMGTLQLVASRFLIGVPALFVALRARSASVGFRERWRPYVLGASVFSTHYLIQTWALETTSATNTGWIVAVMPLTIALLAAIVLKEPIPRAMRVGLVIATLGIVLLISRGELSDLDWLSSTGDWIALASTLTWAVYTIATRDLSRARDPVAVSFAMTLPLAAAGLALPFVLPGWRPITSLSAEVLGALLFLGLGGVALAQWFWQTGVAKLGAARAGLFLYLEPLVTTSLAVPLLGEPFAAAAAAGGILVLAGVFVSQREMLQ